MELTELFLQDRKYLRNVSPATLVFYQNCFRGLPIKPESWKADLLAGIQSLQQRGMQTGTINDYIRGNKAYLYWCHEEGHLAVKPKLSFLKQEQKILATLSAEQIKRVINWKPVRRNDTRAWTLAVTALDTGLRIQELLNLSRQDVDLDNLILRVKGKGNKHRLVPISIELRKVLFRYLSKHQHPRIFATRSGTALTVRNSQRDFKVMCGKLKIEGVRTSWHTLRHTFAVNYLRKGGNLYYLQRILGHSSITTTERYLRSLGIEDLQKVHDGLSLLSR